MHHTPNRTRATPITDDVTFPMPATAHLPSLKLALLGGRDHIANIVKQSGWQAFEHPLPSVFLSTAHQWPGLVIDIGANTGFYTVLAAAAHKNNRILAFEPMADILAALNYNVHENNVQHRVRLIRCAVGNCNGTASLYVPPQDHGLIETSASLRQDFKPKHAQTIDVLQRTLDRVMLQPSLILRRVTIIKIDVEGYESAVLAGAHRTVKRHRPIIFIEVLKTADTAALNNFIHRHNYAGIQLHSAGTLTATQNITHNDKAWNHAFVPNEKLGAFLKLANTTP